MSLTTVNAESIRTDLNRHDGYEKKMQIHQKKLAGMLVLGSISMIAARLYEADRVCGLADTKERYDCVGYVVYTWALLGGIVGSKVGPCAFRAANYIGEGIASRVYEYSHSLFTSNSDNISNV